MLVARGARGFKLVGMEPITTSRVVSVLRAGWELVKTTGSGFMEVKAPRLGAALAFYTLFSIAPLLVIAVSIAGLLFGEDAARGQLSAQLNQVLGEVAGKAVEAMLIAANKPRTSVLASIVGVIMLFIGSTGFFVELQEALNTVWNVKERRGSVVRSLLRQRLLSFGFVLGMGFLLLATLLASAVVTALNRWIAVLPFSKVLLQIGTQGFSFGLTLLLLAMMYKYLPDARIAWRDVSIGAALTAALFTLGKYLIGWYLGVAGFSSTYGAAGALVAILSWVYYSAQIVLFGAEFTQSYAERYGSHVRAWGDAGDATAKLAQENIPEPQSIDEEKDTDKRLPRVKNPVVAPAP